MPLELRPVALAELLETVKDRYTEEADRAGRALHVEVHGSLSLYADPARLGQAVANLVENALRYGQGPVSLTTRSVAEHVEVHVADQGPGFPAGFLELAFDRFSRADPARSRGGAGLGLAIVEAIARAHGGTAHATNRPDGGADVWVALPDHGTPTSRPG